MQSNYIKGLLADIVLHLISTKGEMYGYEISKHTAEITKGAINLTEGALYPVLHKLEQEQILTASFRPVAGRLRKYYALTEKGTEESAAATKDLHTFISTINLILKPKAIKG